LTILLGKGDGTFTTGSTIAEGLSAIPVAVIAADFNGDSKLDLAVANAGAGLVSILLGNGDGPSVLRRNTARLPIRLRW
jgi:hypothetical protein